MPSGFGGAGSASPRTCCATGTTGWPWCSWASGGAPETVTYAELYGLVARMARFLKDASVGPGDRVAGFMPNRIETVVSMLATPSLGAIWSCCSPDFGFKGAMGRFGQTAVPRETGWKNEDATRAAARVGSKASTLRWRIRELGIERG